ncbi:MAG: hypothetical protein HY720_03650 [Planctomycetes bacterium]|nr:hypothetical protein [Planctomycetota bacterium]
MNVSNFVGALIEVAGHTVFRAGHGQDDELVVRSCLEKDSILVTTNREDYMSSVTESHLPEGLRVFALPALNLLQRQTRRRLEREIVRVIFSLHGAPGPFVCELVLDEGRQRLAGYEFLHGAPPSES